MFLRRSFELVTFFGYWCMLIPFAYEILTEKQIIRFDMNHPLVSAGNYAMYLTGAIAVFMVVHRIGLWLYFLIKISDKKMVLNLRNLDKIASEQINETVNTPTLLEKIFNLKRKGTELKNLNSNDLEAGSLSETKAKECDTILETQKKNSITQILLTNSKASHAASKDIAGHQVYDTRSSRILNLLNDIRRHSANKISPNLIQIHHPLGRKAPEVPHIPQFTQTLERNRIRTPSSKTNMEFGPSNFKNNLAFSSNSISNVGSTREIGNPSYTIDLVSTSGSIGFTSLLKPSVFKRTYTNPNLMSDNPDWV